MTPPPVNLWLMCVIKTQQHVHSISRTTLNVSSLASHSAASHLFCCVVWTQFLQLCDQTDSRLVSEDHLLFVGSKWSSQQGRSLLLPHKTKENAAIHYTWIHYKPKWHCRCRMSTVVVQRSDRGDRVNVNHCLEWLQSRTKLINSEYPNRTFYIDVWIKCSRLHNKTIKQW